MNNEEMELFAGKRNVKTKFVKIPLKSLHFYPANPRISSILMNFEGKLDDEKIHMLMNDKQGETCRALFQQIKKDGIINEPLIVYNNEVLEGNTRLWVARELVKQAKDKDAREKWTLLPCRIIIGDLNEEEINYILCNVHIKRKKDWSPFEQACYFARMKITKGMSLQQVKEISTFAITTIKNYIEVYQEMEKHKAEPRDWNRYYEAFKDKPVQELHKSGKYDVIETIKKKTEQGKMGNAPDSRKIKNILTSKRATKMFFEGEADVKRAFEVAVLENPEEGDPLLKRIREIEEDLGHIPFDKLEEIKKDKTKIEIIRSLAKQVKILCSELKIKF